MINSFLEDVLKIIPEKTHSGELIILSNGIESVSQEPVTQNGEVIQEGKNVSQFWKEQMLEIRKRLNGRISYTLSGKNEEVENAIKGLGFDNMFLSQARETTNLVIGLLQIENRGFFIPNLYMSGLGYRENPDSASCQNVQFSSNPNLFRKRLEQLRSRRTDLGANY